MEFPTSHAQAHKATTRGPVKNIMPENPTELPLEALARGLDALGGATPLSTLLKENPAESMAEWNARFWAITHDTPYPEDALAALEYRLAHAKPMVVIGAIKLSCGSTLASIQRNLYHRCKKVRTASMKKPSASWWRWRRSPGHNSRDSPS